MDWKLTVFELSLGEPSKTDLVKLGCFPLDFVKTTVTSLEIWDFFNISIHLGF